MNGEERRQAILDALSQARTPLSGTALGKAVGVTRQAVVTDIALMRRDGHDIISTNRGYVLAAEDARPTRLFKVRHSAEQIEEELRLFVDLGATVENVLVNHRVYGRMSAPLHVKNRRDVARFMDDIRSGASSPLMQVTSGYHFHQVSADDETTLDEVEQALRAAGFLAELTPFEQETFID